MATSPEPKTDPQGAASVAVAADLAGHSMVGTAAVRRVGRWSFPVFELTQDGEALASLGRSGWLKVFFGRGQRVELADGSRWRIKSRGADGAICPVIFDSEGRKIAVSSLGTGTYGINGKHFGCVLYQAEKRRFSRANRWILRRHDVEMGVVTRHPPSIDTNQPLHLGGVLLAFTLARYGILGESAPRLKLRWG